SSVQVLNNNINKLVKAEILFRKGTGTYEVNAKFFGRGKWDDIKEIRSQQTYTSKGRELKTEIIYND
ncbi:hypothetical protein, partial [Xenorhabdus littoralis]|uniref:hypothetical protein n=1 Tax=Xenorhabdus littoralis TaxID=2582835 RepID=UPI0029F3B8DE|nr:hypothetical protein [Xenorhabdus sp. psl]